MLSSRRQRLRIGSLTPHLRQAVDCALRKGHRSLPVCCWRVCTDCTWQVLAVASISLTHIAPVSIAATPQKKGVITRKDVNGRISVKLWSRRTGMEGTLCLQH